MDLKSQKLNIKCNLNSDNVISNIENSLKL